MEKEGVRGGRVVAAPRPVSWTSKLTMVGVSMADGTPNTGHLSMQLVRPRDEPECRCWCCVAAFPVAAEAPSPPADLVLVLDASGSMWGQIDGEGC